MQNRLIPFEGTANFRDIGGYAAGEGRQIPWGRIYRSDSLAELTDADHARLSALALHTIADFRSTEEVAQKPDRLPEGHQIRLLSPGFMPKGASEMMRRALRGEMSVEEIREAVREDYKHFARGNLENYRSTLRAILEAEGAPVLIHCTSGKDRTGFGVALMMRIAGASDADILQDFLLTNQHRRDLSFMIKRPLPPEVMDLVTSAQPEYLQTALATLDAEQGPTESWLSNLGFDAAERHRLRELLSAPL